MAESDQTLVQAEAQAAQQNHTSDVRAQQNTAIFMTVVYICLYTLIGIPLIVCGILGLCNYTPFVGDQVTQSPHMKVDGKEGAFIGMLVVGAVLFIVAMYSIFLAWQMVQEQKKDGKLKKFTTVMMGITLNFYGMIMGLTANGQLRTYEQKKADKAAKKAKKAAKKQEKLAAKKAKKPAKVEATKPVTPMAATN